MKKIVRTCYLSLPFARPRATLISKEFFTFEKIIGGLPKKFPAVVDFFGFGLFLYLGARCNCSKLSSKLSAAP